MKKSHVITLIAAIAMCVLTISSCKKDNETYRGNYNPSAQTGSEVISDFLSQRAPKSQSFTVNASGGGTVSGTDGTTIFFPASAFKDLSGNSVSGNVEVNLKEYNTIGDMAFSGVTTVSDGEMIESAGMFHLSANQNGKILQAAKPFFVQVQQNKIPKNQFQIFEGQEKRDTVAGDSNRVNWRQRDSANVQQRDSGNLISMYFNYFKFGYCNIDRFYNEFKGNKISSFEIKVPAGYDNRNTWALLLFKDYKSCASAYWHSINERFQMGYTLGSGIKCKVLVVAVKDADKKEFEYSLKEVTLTDQTVVNITSFQKVTEAQIEAIVKGL
jgi:hypothetical protein